MGKVFDHERLRVYRASIDFLAWLEGLYPEIERKVSAHDHLVRASASVPVNIAEASGKSSMNERRQFIDTAYGSSLESAACLDVLCVLECISPSMARTGKRQLSGIVSMLIGFRESSARRVREEPVPYGRDNGGDQTVLFDHERLEVYRRAIDFVRWCDEFRKKDCIARSVEIALDRSSTGLALNIAEGNGKFSKKDRCRFIGHARTAALQAAAHLDVIAVRNSQMRHKTEEGKGLLADSVRMLVAWQKRVSGD
jgi:four helix bundle protein